MQNTENLERGSGKRVSDLTTITRRMLCTVVNGRNQLKTMDNSYKDCKNGKCFFLVLAHTVCPEQRAIKWLLLLFISYAITQGESSPT